MFIVVMHLALQALSSASSQAFHLNEETNITNRTEILLRIPTGRRLTSWLFTKHRGVRELGTTENKSIQWQGAGLEPGTSGIQVQRPNH